MANAVDGSNQTSAFELIAAHAAQFKLKCDLRLATYGARQFRSYTIEVPRGSGTQAVEIREGQDNEEWARLNIGQWRFLGALHGVWNPTTGWVECAFEGPSPDITRDLYRELCRRCLGIDVSEGEAPELIVDTSGGAFHASVGPASPRFWVMMSCVRDYGRKHAIGRTTLKVTGLAARNEAALIDLLEDLFNNIFLKVDVKLDSPFELLRVRRTHPLRPLMRNSTQPFTLSVVKHDYDRNLMRFYWYARSASGKPLLQFLGLEYTFPHFASVRIRRLVRASIIDPRFDPNDDEHLLAIVTAAQGADSRRGPAERDHS